MCRKCSKFDKFTWGHFSQLRSLVQDFSGWLDCPTSACCKLMLKGRHGRILRILRRLSFYGAQWFKYGIFASTCRRRASAFQFKRLVHSTYIQYSIGVGEWVAISMQLNIAKVNCSSTDKNYGQSVIHPLAFSWPWVGWAPPCDPPWPISTWNTLVYIRKDSRGRAIGYSSATTRIRVNASGVVTTCQPELHEWVLSLISV